MGSESADSTALRRIIAERPWVLLIYLMLLDSGGVATASDIATALDMRTYVVKRAMWWLKKYGLVEIDESSTPRKYKVKLVPPLAESLRSSKRVCGNSVVVEYGESYLLFLCREHEVIVRRVPKKFVEAYLRGERLGEELAPKIRRAIERVAKTIMCRS
ncbi:MAG: hypothetical protein DRO12_02565 [Thermoprotei archaeon]|nr:MAG: hypothetical protein DRO12_02565 [Thermoprotei archaeon]